MVRHFESNHSRTKDGRFVVPLPKDPRAKLIGESRSQAVRRLLSLERSLNTRGCFNEFDDIMQEYLDLGHTEVVPIMEMEKPLDSIFYLPMHAVYKASSTTTKVRAVFAASAKSSTGVSLLRGNKDWVQQNFYKKPLCLHGHNFLSVQGIITRPALA